MSSWNLGSVSDEVFNLVDDIPENISGTTLLNMIDRKRIYMEQYLGATIGSTAIADKYQGPLINLSCGDLLNFINIHGTDASEVKLGEFSVKKGGGDFSPASTAANAFDKQAMQELNELKDKYNYYRSW